MISFKRKLGESLILVLEDGRQIRICLQSAYPKEAKLGVQCDRSILVLRGELLADGESPAPAPEPGPRKEPAASAGKLSYRNRAKEV